MAITKIPGLDCDKCEETGIELLVNEIYLSTDYIKDEYLVEIYGKCNLCGANLVTSFEYSYTKLDRRRKKRCLKSKLV